MTRGRWRTGRRLPRALAFCAPLLLLSATADGETIDRVELLTQTVRVKGQSSVSGFALRMHLESWAAEKGMRIVPAIEYWRDSDRFPEFGIAHASQQDWTLGADARYRFDVKKSWRPYAGAGMGLHFLKSTFEPVGEQEAANTSTRLGLNFLLGVDLPPASSLQSSIELNYHLVSGFQQLKINWGFGVTF